MNLLWIVLQQAPAAQEVPNVFNLSLGTSFWTVVIFLILLFVLGKYALPPILGYAEAREQSIQQSLDEAKAARDEAQATLEQQRRELAAAREQAQQVIGEAKQAAERVRQDMLSQARKEQEALLERARDEIEREQEQAVEAVRREAVDLSLAAASKLIRRRLDAEEDRKLVRQFLSELVAGGNGAGAA